MVLFLVAARKVPLHLQEFSKVCVVQSPSPSPFDLLSLDAADSDRISDFRQSFSPFELPVSAEEAFFVDLFKKE